MSHNSRDTYMFSQGMAPPGNRCDHKVHSKIKQITESHTFNGCIIAIIFINALFMALETEEALSHLQLVFDYVDYTFLAIYTVEFFLKIYAEPLYYWRSMYNLFDFLVLAISFAQVIFIFMWVLKTLRSGIKLVY